MSSIQDPTSAGSQRQSVSPPENARASRSHLFARATASPAPETGDADSEAAPAEENTVEDPAPLSSIWDTPVELCVELARGRYRLGDLASLRAGAVVTLNAMAGDPVELYAGGGGGVHALVARGDLVVIDGALSVRITEMESLPVPEAPSGA
jgi:flagellar motor switch protein FliN/FliY